MTHELALVVLLLGSLFWCVGFGVMTLLGVEIPERRLVRSMEGISALGVILCSFLVYGVSFTHPTYVNLGDWYQYQGFSYHLDLILTGETALFLFFAHILFLLVVMFAGNYLHREIHFQRFMLFISFLQWGLMITAIGGSLDFVFFGWEVVGVASCLLIGFFLNHRSAGIQSLRAFVSYKISDVGLILACLFLHHGWGSTLIHEPNLVVAKLEPHLLELISLCLIFGTLAKGGLFPLGGWLPRAMEGPTPSSAIFYGSLSVHLAPLLLLRTKELWIASSYGPTVIFLIGLWTALWAGFTGRTRSNVKTQLGYAVMTQMGLIYMELGFGFFSLALAHMVSHSFLRTIQYLRSGSILRDFHQNSAIYSLTLKDRTPTLEDSQWSPSWSHAFYIHAWNGFYLDALVQKYLIQPFFSGSQKLHRLGEILLMKTPPQSSNSMERSTL
jgi:NADH-quinone oxidoreductase subunit L